jgi:hypothetical protein
MTTATKLVQTIEQAEAAIVAAGHKSYGGKFYDPRKRGAYVELRAGYCDKEFDDFVLAVENASVKKGGPSGAFCCEIRNILDADRAAIKLAAR